MTMAGTYHTVAVPVVAVAAADTPQAVAAAISKRLREIAATLDSQVTSSYVQVADELQLLAQKVQAAAASVSQEAPAANGAVKASAGGAAAPESHIGAPSAAAVDSLERSYAAPAVPGAVDAELANLQPLTKKQRRGEHCWWV